jgi:hypothetical protein
VSFSALLLGAFEFDELKALFTKKAPSKSSVDETLVPQHK